MGRWKRGHYVAELNFKVTVNFHSFEELEWPCVAVSGCRARDLSVCSSGDTRAWVPGPCAGQREV